MKKNLLRILAPTIAFIVLVLGTTVLIPADNVVKADQPDRLRIDGISWNSTSQRFVVDLSCQKGMVKGGTKAHFQVLVELWINPGGYDIIQTTQQAIEIQGSQPDKYGMVKIAPIYVPWPRPRVEGTAFTGDVFVTTNVQLINRPGRQPKGNLVTDFRTINIPTSP